MNLFRELIKGYTFYSPIDKGKYRLTDLAIKFSRAPEGEITFKTTDGRNFTVDSSNISYKYACFIGEYEPAITGIFRELVRPGDVCLDIGANIGWYATLFQKLVGPKGQVHAFEPVPPTFEHLKRNVKLNEPPENVRLNNFALGDTEMDVDLNIFTELPDGHASISTFDRKDVKVYSSHMITLDSYLSDNKIDNVALVKVDIEGAELMMLKGATSLFRQSKLPIFEIEMALATTSGFGYLPNDIIEFMREQADYKFFAIDDKYGTLRRIDHFAADDIGANVLCMPADMELGRLAKRLA